MHRMFLTWLNNLSKEQGIKVVRVHMAPAATIHKNYDQTAEMQK